MEVHIEETIKQVEARVVTLQALVSELRRFGGEDGNRTSLPVGHQALSWEEGGRVEMGPDGMPGKPHAKDAKDAKGKHRTSNAERPTSNGKTGKKGELNGRSAVVVGKMGRVGATFTSEEVGEALGIAKGSSQLSRWKDLGWVRRLGGGRGERTGKWPTIRTSSNIQAPSTSEAPRTKPNLGLAIQTPEKQPAQDRGGLEEKLAGALKARDRAREMGQERLERIHQQEVDRISAVLGE